MAEYIPHKDVTADEAVVSFKGRLGFIGLVNLV